MSRPDAIAMHENARRYRSRLMAVLARRLLRRMARAMRGPRATVARPAAARYPMPQQQGSSSSRMSAPSAFTKARPVMVGTMRPLARSNQR